MNLHNLILFKLIFLLFFTEVFARIIFTQVVNTTSGPVRGLIRKTVVSKMKYSSFRGIRYGQPPTGKRRFQPPIPAIPKITVHNAIRDSDVCPQFDLDLKTSIGNEDCLFLNVYTPEITLPKKMQMNRAVMVWIHGGAFLWGSVNSSYYGPDFLLEKDVVVVAMNYRLGAFGFLKLDPNITGNMGLKDQVLALQWVKKNIKAFGGNPKKVTIFGQSAGAVSVELHRLSRLSRGLFRASIAMSGSPLNPWGFIEPEVVYNMSEKFVKLQSAIFGYGENDSIELSLEGVTVEVIREEIQNLWGKNISDEEVYSELMNQETANIVRTSHQLVIAEIGLIFLPTTEKSSRLAFLDKYPQELLKNRSFANVPHIIGYTREEIIGIKQFYQYIYLKIPMVYAIYKDAINIKATKAAFMNGIEQTITYIFRKSGVKVWSYINTFDYPESLHKIDGIDLKGCGHTDDIAHIFYVRGKNQPLDPKSDIGQHREIMVTMWTNFAKDLNPESKELGIKWPDIREGECFLQIGEFFECVGYDEDFVTLFLRGLDYSFELLSRMI